MRTKSIFIIINYIKNIIIKVMRYVQYPKHKENCMINRRNCILGIKILLRYEEFPELHFIPAVLTDLLHISPATTSLIITLINTVNNHFNIYLMVAEVNSERYTVIL
jgi:hypothetical protein